MGLFDTLKKKLGGAKDAITAAPAPVPDPVDDAPQDEPTDPHDLAGFDPIGDEESFFNAVLHMESEGQFGGTDESRAEIQDRFGIRDRAHWQTVKDAVYQ